MQALILIFLYFFELFIDHTNFLFTHSDDVLLE